MCSSACLAVDTHSPLSDLRDENAERVAASQLILGDNRCAVESGWRSSDREPPPM